jgi:hypothetical protein
MLPIKMATSIGNFGKRFLEGTFFIYHWIAKIFPPIVLFAIIQNRFGKILFPFIPWW